MQYKIKSFVYPKGKEPTKATLIDPTGKETTNVALWDKSWPIAASRGLVEGNYLEGELKTEPKEFNGKIYENSTLFPPKATATKSYGAPRATKAQDIAVAQEKKAEYIEQAQDRKNLSIAYFNSTNAAIEVCAKLIDFLDDDGKGFAIEQSIIHWREFFLSEWKKYAEKNKLPF